MQENHMKENSPPKTRTALVTGAARGLGRGIALGLAEDGCDLILNDLRDTDELQAVAMEIRGLGQQARVEIADVSDEAAVDAMFERIAARGPLDILINNAGTAHAADIFAITAKDWHRVIDTNLTSCFLCSRRAAGQMRAGEGGRIVSISSISGQQGALFGHVHYSASKAGIVGFTKALARTLAPLGVTVNAVAPGIIDTELLRRTHEGQVEQIAAGIPLGLGRVEDVAAAVCFLCGPGARYITGATLDVNGGMYLR